MVPYWFGMKPDVFHFPSSRKLSESGVTRSVRYPHQWLPSKTGKHEQFADWRYLALQIMRREKSMCSIMSVFEHCFDFESCECLMTNAEIADEAGRCSEKTVSREVAVMTKLGLIRCETVWTEKLGKKVKGRRIRLSVPVDLDGIHNR